MGHLLALLIDRRVTCAHAGCYVHELLQAVHGVFLRLSWSFSDHAGCVHSDRFVYSQGWQEVEYAEQ
jgi:hypothetical protein